MRLAPDFDLYLKMRPIKARLQRLRHIDRRARNLLKLEAVDEPSESDEHIRDSHIVAYAEPSSYMAQFH